MKHSHQVFSAVVFSAVFSLAGCSKKSSPAPPAPAPLKVTGLSVSQGPYGTNVTISGTGFSTTATDDMVAFNGKLATVSSASSTQLTAIVPIGAGTGDVTVTVNGVTITGPVFSYLFTASVTTLAGSTSPGSKNGIGTAASFADPYAIAVDATGNVYVVDMGNQLIRKITPAGVVTTLAGSGSVGSANGAGTAASFNYPTGIAVDASGNVYVADNRNLLIRKITPAGVVSTFAGGGTPYSFVNPSGLTIDPNGNLYVTDGQAIREITPSGVVTTLGAAFDEPLDLAFQNNTIYVSDADKDNIYAIVSGHSNLIAGSGTAGLVNGSTTAASFSFPSGLAVDQAGNMYVADTNNSLIRAITPGGVVTTLAGGATGPYGEINGVGTASSFDQPTGMAIDAAGNLYVSDVDGNEVRKIVLQ